MCYLFFVYIFLGPAHLLRFTNAPKNLLLKEGAPVLLIRNISHGLFNGTRGKVHTLKKDCPPVIEVDGKLITLSHYKFELYDREQKKVLATRMQYPIMLSFAMTVHRAQGQTLEFVDVDCASFFAAGQLGVAIGRVKSKNGLRVRNLNRTAAVLKHAACVYEFYDKINHAEAFVDLSCCNAVTSYASDLNLSHGACNSVVAECVENNEIIDDNIEMVDVELPKLPCPWSIEEFISLNKGGSFLTSLPENFYHCERLSDHLQFLYYNVNKIVLAPFASNKSQLWNAACTSLNKFLLSDAHINACKQLFHVNMISKSHNKFSTKLVWWLLEKQVDKKASEIISSQTEKVEGTDNTKTYSSAGKAKIRHVAGASVCKITQKLQASVLNNMGTTSKKGKMKQKFDYKMQTMLRNFRIKEIEAPQDDTMTEILSKQGPSRGLTIVNDEVFSFFLNLNTAVQKKTSFDYFHLYGKMAFHTCRNAIDNNDELINQWINLFGSVNDDNIEDEIFITLIMELWKDVTEHFIRTAFGDALNAFKASVPRKKKQALRDKVKALGERGAKEQKLDTVTAENTESYICNICKQICEDEPTDDLMQSIACDQCNCWYHFKCSKLTGTESFITKKSKTWLCINCSIKGKGVGKRKVKGKKGN